MSEEEQGEVEKSEEGVDPEIVDDGEIIQAEESSHVSRQVRFEAWSGPLPAPSDFQAYEDVVEGAANRIMKMAEIQLAHRVALEAKTLDRSYWGLAAGFIIAMTALISGVVVTLNGYPLAGFGIIGVDLVSLVSLFVFGIRIPRGGRPRIARGQSEKGEPSDDRP
ncbi:MAG: DUF2335 domain-containing protein [Caldilineaceae bacterium SB0670_bin_27]|uniref:DUF2335 domain-containing protein n=1 Tax=Caldilineaceae bacterium SB0664_bin_27 TaxID=2605260 RepID=A0A6B0Z1K0_9CHLR|nr:DUF2335 domain-containing protein [Caldilineaceae bacterium SB0664_bin_27]MYJ78552.1 DUF2335 domain-containing protein [Caldilineaceae bacterium SB0670_bin_27]